ncbi:hypothetical protein EJD97_009455 [Solanum chilense]|uniref:Uncharacterized protein n=1 Tax=Solanum chilense TaxID=4083 RepID=A0A6N2BJY0_SOLCI|nr:hypothetical protein EJD97_009455 [Solanum chilense]
MPGPTTRIHQQTTTKTTTKSHQISAPNQELEIPQRSANNNIEQDPPVLFLFSPFTISLFCRCLSLN